MAGNMQDDSALKDAQKRKFEDISKRQAAEAQLKAIVNKVFEPAAISRLSNIRMSNENMYMQIVQFFVSAIQAGKLSGKVTEEQVKQVAMRMLSGRRETTIRRA